MQTFNKSNITGVQSASSLSEGTFEAMDDCQPKEGRKGGKKEGNPVKSTQSKCVKLFQIKVGLNV